MKSIRSEYGPTEVQVFGDGSVLLRGAAVIDAVHLVERGIRLGPQSAHSGRFLALRRQLSKATISPRNNETQLVEDASSFVPCGDEHPMSVAEAAELLGLTIRRVQQLARELGGRRIGHHWRLDRGLVLAHKNFRDYRRDEETDG